MSWKIREETMESVPIAEVNPMTEAGTDSKRVVFTFDSRSYDALKQLTRDTGSRSMADTVREALRIARALKVQADHGYTEVIVRNPKKDRERILVIPLFE